MNKALISAYLTILMWASLATLMLSVSHLPSLLLVGLVLLVASLPGLGYWRQWRFPIKVWVSAVVGMFGYHYLLFDAFTRAPAMSVNMIQYLWPLFIVLGAPLFGSARLNFGHIVGAALGFAGVLLTMTQGELAFGFSEQAALGYAQAFVAALLWAFYTLSNRRYQQMPLSAVAGFCLVSGALALVAYFVSATESVVQWQYADMGSILLLGLGPMGLSFYTWDYAIRHGDPRQIGALTYLTPLLSVAMLALVYSDVELKLVHLLSLILVIGGASLGQVVERRRLKPKILANS
ncbi:DMT family transporter [Agarivorans gilvus]|jgi:drug/metabolite transporter (DMT)-like permease|uniref:Permease n=1 Tax=Agarivorans gilvus TaxID=680279 RepID=A0ABQ1HW77_9ALTE|nr:EamA family transporter [Agarivorans gilvus]GGA94556.1 permease [Agarivorans gilvus]